MNLYEQMTKSRFLDNLKLETVHLSTISTFKLRVDSDGWGRPGLISQEYPLFGQEKNFLDLYPMSKTSEVSLCSKFCV